MFLEEALTLKRRLPLLDKSLKPTNKAFSLSSTIQCRFWCKKLLFFIILLVLNSSQIAQAAGTTAAGVLLKSPHAKPLSMAESFSSISSDLGGISALHYNPSAPAFLNRCEASFMGQKGLVEDNFGTFFLGIPTNWGTYSTSILYYNLGDVELIDTLGQSKTVTAQEDLVASFNYSETILEKYGTGISLKIIHAKLVETFSSNAIAIDFGGLVKFFNKQCALGFSAQNIGSKLTYINTSESLPLTVRGGLSYHVSFKNLGFKNWGSSLLSFDVVKETEQNLKSLIGFEYLWNETLALRAGTKIGQDRGKYNFGIGFLIGNFGLDYALTDSESLGKSHSASLTYLFEIKSLTPQSRKPSEKNSENEKF
ncbi:MAG: hypothetical protein A3I11_08605 [Elusimicrobia bacterium RIFCSPLOWO2_02_FULL_39_32]|nr:MAG: hypothetical protein A3B80_08870 [Elusimicrobia bacterium RIFCSPHIGHO2_02_FULL_39_36]OGR93228.1 MAG: hypothetical protein A3I11_08605 [Elusimicrobia bacterium RIFCSPLOWO2_02_FULL_39_32]OGR99453.1 MAG: hypothetical protein A3G85_07050 [Elusimicrobia bacterium RIFCSPLOWO2_12_FULL_39_28]